MKWMYGVTTVPSRRGLLPATISSLKSTGFDVPHLFSDGEGRPKLGTVGNWITALWTLYLLDPHADRYAIFQDDVTFCLGLREYLESVPWREKTYLNLYSSEYNEVVVKKTPPGNFVESYVLNSGGLPNGGGPERWQCGKGALAIVFDGEGVTTLLQSRAMVMKPRSREMPRSKLDGMIVNAMNQAGYRELIHSPSLCQHAGRLDSAMGNDPRPLAQSFPGENFDARDFLRGK